MTNRGVDTEVSADLVGETSLAKKTCAIEDGLTEYAGGGETALVRGVGGIEVRH
jgi:hypothetical protein